MCTHENKIVRTNGPHLQEWCPDCECHIRFIPKDKDAKRRPKDHKSLVNKYSNGYCECCLRTKESLPQFQTLEAHHVRPYHLGGESTRENIWIVCTPCHRLIEHFRTYMGHYSGQFKFSDNG